MVAIQAVRGNGILAHAKNARDEYQKAQTDEEEMLDMLNDAITGQSLKETWKLSADGSEVTKGSVTLKIGDYVNYTPKPEKSTYESSKLGQDYTGSTSNSSTTLETESNLKWRVLGVDGNGCLTLISDQKTSKNIYFSNAKGYNNGVYILNDICKTLYSNTELGVTARSLTIEDIEAGFSEEGKNKRNEYKTSDVTYGNPKTYTSNLQYPVIYAEEKGSGISSTSVREDGIGGSIPFYTTEDELKTKPKRQGEEAANTSKESDTASSNLTCTQTYYYLSKDKQYFKSEEFMNLIFPTSGYYWLASRYVSCDSDYAYFGLRRVYSSRVLGYGLFYSDGNADNDVSAVRPVVSLGSDIKVTKCTSESTDSSATDEAHMHQLSKAN